MSNYLGDFATSSIVYLGFNTSKSDGTPITLAGTPAVSVYKNGSTTESTAGVTLSVDFDSRTGFHLAAIDTSSDGTFYAAGGDFRAVITAGTVDTISVVGDIVGSFSLANRSALRPTVAGKTLDVSNTGEAGIDWANVGSPTTTVGLSGTTISTSQAVASVTSSTAQTGDSFARLGAPAGASVSADVAAIKSDTISLPTYVGMARFGVVAASPSPTTTAFKVTLNTPLSGSTIAADVIGDTLQFTGDPRGPSSRRITSCTINDTSNVTLGFTLAFGAAPVAGNTCAILS